MTVKRRAEMTAPVGLPAPGVGIPDLQFEIGNGSRVRLKGGAVVGTQSRSQFRLAVKKRTQCCGHDEARVVATFAQQKVLDLARHSAPIL